LQISLVVEAHLYQPIDLEIRSDKFDLPGVTPGKFHIFKTAPGNRLRDFPKSTG
jgi:hypothetical protein